MIDFGASAKIDPQRGIRGLYGTAVYCAKEVAQISRPYDEKCDIWSLGVLMYFLLTRGYPFEGQDDIDTLNLIIRAKNYPTKSKALFLNE